MEKPIKKIKLLLPVVMLYATAAQAYDPDFYNTLAERFMIGGTLLVFVIVAFALMNLFNVVIKEAEAELYQEQGITAPVAPSKVKKESFWKRFNRMMTRAVPVEREKDILFDHEYDGIQELDNSLPPWWLYGFYLTIGIAIFYIGFYHFSDYAISSHQLYAQEMESAQRVQNAFLARQANLIDESTVTAITDPASLAEGKSIYVKNCVACHLETGAGLVGPNLTDDYWIHGGGIKNVFKTIKYGVPEKGMIAWKNQLVPTDIHKVASYILTLHGTNPPNAKAPEGDLYQPEEETTRDTTQVMGMNVIQ